MLFVLLLPALPLLGGGAENVRVTGVDDGHGGAPVQLTASGAELDLGSHISYCCPPKPK